MGFKKNITSLISLVLCAAALLCIAASCAGQDEPEPAPERTFPPPPPASTPIPTSTPVALGTYTGIVESIVLHEVIAWPQVAFSSSSRELLDAEYATALELRRMLEQLYANNYVLINFNDIYSDSMAPSGYAITSQNVLEIPVGKKPIVIFFDNMNFSESFSGQGFMSRYIIGTDGDIWAEGIDPDGNYITSQDLTAITIVDKFVRENPDFSHNGAKGCLALTGAQGILGYRTGKAEEETDGQRLRRMQEAAFARSIVARLKDTGWYFASHTYSRSRLGNMTLEDIKTDNERWKDEVGSLVGITRILTYPAGSRLDGNDQDAPGPAMQYYVENGYRYFGSYGSNHHVKIKSEDYNITAVVFDRAFICGTVLRNHVSILRRLFDAETVIDTARP